MNDLKMLTQEELAELLGTTRQHVSVLRAIGIIKAIKIGKCYMFSQAEIKRFEDVYKGLDVSNKIKALESYKLVNGIN